MTSLVVTSIFNGSKNKMRMKGKTILYLLAAGSLLLAGCQKENFGNTDGIRFKTSAGMGTKTVYGDDVTESGTTWQIIDWKVDDVIRIYSDKAVHRYATTQHFWDYEVTGKSISGHLSYATIQPAVYSVNGMRNGLVWADEPDTYLFYGIYPATDCANGASGVLNGSIPADQAAGDADTNLPQYGFLTAAQKISITSSDYAKENKVITLANGGPEVELRFEPAFTAFEFDLTADGATTLVDFTMTTEESLLTGPFTVTYGGTDGLTPTYAAASSGTGKSITVTFPANTVISPTADYKFTVFALPLDITGATISFTVKNAAGYQFTRSLKLDKKNTSGVFEPVEFAARKKHRITADMKAVWCFKYIDITGKAYDWEVEAVNEVSADNPQASQFEVTGEGVTEGSARQTWILNGNTATVSFKIFTPESGTWMIVPQGDVDKFTVTYNGSAVTGESFSGAIRSSSDPVTRVEFTVAPNGAASGDRIWFKTYAIDSHDVQFSLDSETQLYDIRGYHYFMNAE